MKHFFLFLFSFFSFTAFAQVLNSDFENASGGDLSNWQATCGAQSFNNAPPLGGNWSIQVFGGNTQGCFPGYAYQKLPNTVNGDLFVLSCQAFAETPPFVGIYFGKINNGVITIQVGDTTSSGTWKELEVLGQANLASVGDTAVVILSGGTTGGPAQGYGYFDLVQFVNLVSINAGVQSQSLKAFPNPFSTQTVFTSEKILHSARLTVCNAYGQIVRQETGISGQKITFERRDLPSGIYYARIEEKGIPVQIAKMMIMD